MAKAKTILSSIVSELIEEHGLKEENMLSRNTQSRIKTMESSMLSASLLILGMTGTFNIGTSQILTAVSDVVCPQADADNGV